MSGCLLERFAWTRGASRQNKIHCVCVRYCGSDDLSLNQENMLNHIEINKCIIVMLKLKSMANVDKGRVFGIYINVGLWKVNFCAHFGDSRLRIHLRDKSMGKRRHAFCVILGHNAVNGVGLGAEHLLENLLFFVRSADFAANTMSRIGFG